MFIGVHFLRTILCTFCAPVEYEFEIQLAENKINTPVDYYKNKREYEILLLEKTGSNPNKLQQLMNEKKFNEEVNKIDIVEHYKKRPLK
jgi:hypothetical protein